MKFNRIMTMAAALVCGGSIMAAEEYSFATPDAWQQSAALTASGNSLIVNGQVFLTGKKLIKVPEGSDLQINGTYKAVAGTQKNTMYLGFRTYDANRREFREVNIRTIAGTLTALTADAKKGDTAIMVADAAKWLANYSAVWGAKEDLSDLPNYNILPVIAKIEKSGDAWKISFKKPLAADLAKGTAVRCHQPGGYMYYVFTATIPGAVNPKRNTNRKGIWPQAKYVRFIVLANWKNGKDAKLEMIDPKVTIIPPVAK